jgi:outer membrane protein, multidrug efflux system
MMLRKTYLLLPLALLSGCASVGDMPPRPETVLPQNFVFAPAGAGAEVEAFATLLPSQTAAFRALMQKAAAAPDLGIALERIEAARGVAARARAERRPAIDAGVSAQGQRSNPAQFGNISGGIDATQYSLGGDISARWDLDIFGGLRASQRAAERRVDAAGYGAQAVRIAIAAEVASAVADWQSIRAQRRQVEANLASAEQRAGLVRSRVRAGLNPALDGLCADAVVEGLRAQIAPLDGERAAIAARMVALTGADASAVIADLDSDGSDWGGGSAPRTAPSTLIAARPDVQAAAARLAACDADLAAVAAQRFTLSSSIGLLAYAFGGLFDSDALVGSVGAGIAGPLLDFGRIQAEIDQSKAQTQVAFEELRKATFGALGEAESRFGQLAAADAEAASLRQQAAREAEVARVSASRYRAGLESLISVLDQDRIANQAQQQAVAAAGRAQRARVLLWQSLGGPGTATLYRSGD